MTLLTMGLLLAEEPGKGPDYGKASPIGLLVVVLLLIGVFALVRSMNRHLRKVPASFEDAHAAATPETTEAAPGAATDAAPDTAPDTEVPPRESAG